MCPILNVVKTISKIIYLILCLTSCDIHKLVTILIILFENCLILLLFTYREQEERLERERQERERLEAETRRQEEEK